MYQARSMTAAVLAVTLLSINSTFGQEPIVGLEFSQLVTKDGTAIDEFATAVAASEGTVVVGAKRATHDGTPATEETGAVYVFVGSNGAWTQQARLVAPLGQVGDRFGARVAIHRNMVLVAAPGDDEVGADAGAVYAFGRAGTAWVFLEKLHAENGGDFGRFGGSLSLDRDRAVIGARADSSGAALGGSAYVFEWTSNGGWVQTAKLQPEQPQYMEFFSGDVALDHDRIVIGAYGHQHPEGGPGGAAYVFTLGPAGWTQETILYSETNSVGDAFGRRVDIHGRTVAVGAMFADQRAGAVHLFEAGPKGWIEGQRLVATDRAPFDQFGASLVLGEGSLMIGAPLNDDLGSSSGAAYLFAREGASWVQTDKLRARGGAAEDRFGSWIAMSDSTVAVCAPNSDGPGAATGSVTLFEIEPRIGTLLCMSASGVPCPCDNDPADPAQGCTHTGGVGMELSASGTTSLTTDDLVLTVLFAPRGEGGFFYAGTESLEAGSVLHDGLQCVHGEGRRFRMLTSFDEVSGVVSDTGFVAQDRSGAFFRPGATYTFQYWTRDILQGWSPCGRGSNFSPAMAVRLEH